MKPRMSRTGECRLWDLALREGLAIITKDEDFAQRKFMVDGGPTVIWRLPNTRRRDLIAWFAKILPDILVALDRGETLIEVV